MSLLFNNTLILIVNNLSKAIFTLSTETLNGLNYFINNNEFESLYPVIFGISITIAMILLLFKGFVYFSMDRVQKMESKYRIKKEIKSIIILLIICLNYRLIINFTFGYCGKLLNDTTVISVLKGDFYGIDNTTLLDSLIEFTSAILSVFIAITQVIEVISLNIILLLSPVIMMGNSFFQELISKFLRYLTQGIVSPIIQTVIMYMTVEIIIPSLIVNTSNLVLPIQLILVFFIFQSFNLSKVVANLLLGSISSEKSLNKVNDGIKIVDGN